MADSGSKTKMWQRQKGAEDEPSSGRVPQEKRKSEYDNEHEPYRKKTDSSPGKNSSGDGSGFLKNKSLGSNSKLKFGLGSGGASKESKPKTGITMGISKPGLKMSLGGAPQATKKTSDTVVKKPVSLAGVFNDDSESDEEEMPPEARMRMRNVGKFTPTSAGPNSYGKGKMGFCDRQKMLEKQIMDEMDEEERKSKTS